MASAADSARWTFAASLLALPMLLVACGGDSPTDPGNPDPDPDPTTGSVTVSATTTGEDVDADGYSVTVDGSSRGTIGPNGSTTVSDLAAGTYTVAIGGVAENCAEGTTTSQSVTVTAGQTATAAFDVACLANVGVLRVQAATDGLEIDPDGYLISLDGDPGQAIEANGELFVEVGVGNVGLDLSGQAANCTPHTEPTAEATMTFGDTTSVTFDVTCFRDPVLVIQYDGNTDQLYAVDASGGPMVNLSTADGLDFMGFGRTSSFNPDRTHFVFQANDANAGFAEYDIYVMALNKSEMFRYTNPGPDLVPTWSPDGTEIAFSSASTGQIYTATPDLSTVTALTNGRVPMYSPDGTQLAFFRGDDLYVASASGAGAVNVSNPGSNRPADTTDEFGGWAPDGSAVLFRRLDFASGEGTLYLTDPTGAAEPTLFPGPTETVESAAMGPDGRVYYTLCTAFCGEFDVWSAEQDGSGAMQLTSSGEDFFTGEFNATTTFDGPVSSGAYFLTQVSGRTLNRVASDGSGSTELITNGDILDVAWD